jgi:hypothetical protein
MDTEKVVTDSIEFASTINTIICVMCHNGDMLTRVYNRPLFGMFQSVHYLGYWSMTKKLKKVNFGSATSRSRSCIGRLNRCLCEYIIM